MRFAPWIQVIAQSERSPSVGMIVSMLKTPDEKSYMHHMLGARTSTTLFDRTPSKNDRASRVRALGNWWRGIIACAVVDWSR